MLQSRFKGFLYTNAPVWKKWARLMQRGLSYCRSGLELRDGAGVFVLKRAFADTGCVNEATAIFESIIEAEKKSGPAADHFAKAGANDRIWNAQEKLCLTAPEVFPRCFSNRWLPAAAEAWLGPCFQVTSQVNVVRPGGEAQQAHRDYHLGFQSAEVAASFPAHVHGMSPFLTLQGAVAHSDMTIESGPTKLLPYSQRYAQGYVAWRRADFREYFENNFVQVPLAKGDAIFFNPALFHAAGSNRTSHVQRMANLLQISSAYGRAMEVVNRTRMSETLYPVLRDRLKAGNITEPEALSVIASCAEGYPSPTTPACQGTRAGEPRPDDAPSASGGLGAGRVCASPRKA